MKKISAMTVLGIGVGLVVLAGAVAAAVLLPNVLDDEEPALSAEDVNTEYNVEAGEQIDLTGMSGAVNITTAGDYYLSGVMTDGYLNVSVGKNNTVHLFLDEVDITSSDYAAIYVEKTSKVIITLVDGSENRLVDGTTRVNLVEDEPDGALFSKADLTINGGGALSIVAKYADGIVSKDNLVIAGGAIVVEAKEHGVRGTDSVLVAGGETQITCGTDGVHSNGYISLESGSVAIAAGDDGMHADNKLTVSGGTLRITKSLEGLEAAEVNISGGEIGVVASDDGINAAGGDGSGGGDRFTRDTGVISISGGVVRIDAKGDGVDSNGDINMSGGEVYVNGPSGSGNGALDYDGYFNITGGVLIAVGSSGMAEVPSTSSSQYSFGVTVSAGAGSEIKVTDANGVVVAEIVTVRAIECVVVSAPAMARGESYEVYVDGASKQSVTLGGVVTTVGNFGMGGGGGGMQGMR